MLHSFGARAGGDGFRLVHTYLTHWLLAVLISADSPQPDGVNLSEVHLVPRGSEGTSMVVGLPDVAFFHGVVSKAFCSARHVACGPGGALWQ